MWKYSMCLLFHAVICPTPQVCTSRVLGAAATTRWVFVTRKPYLAYHVTGISEDKIFLHQKRLMAYMKALQKLEQMHVTYMGWKYVY